MTVTTTTKTFTQIYEDLLEKYKNPGTFTPASALFYWDNGSDYGVRIEAPGIMREFVDKIAFGHDPTGTLFYHNVADFGNGQSKTVKYNVYYNTGVSDSEKAVVVQFYYKTQGSFFAEFVGRNYGDVAYLREAQQGHWGALDTASASAFVEKNTTEKTVTVTINSIGRQVSFDVPSDPNDTYVGVWGTLTFKDLSNLSNGTRSIVDYNDDRILFYPTNNKTDLTAVFIPEENTAADATALGPFKFFRENNDRAAWGNIDN